MQKDRGNPSVNIYDTSSPAEIFVDFSTQKFRTIYPLYIICRERQVIVNSCYNLLIRVKHNVIRLIYILGTSLLADSHAKYITRTIFAAKNREAMSASTKSIVSI